MIGVLLALGAGLGFGCSNAIGRMAMDRSSVFHAAFWSVAVTTAVLVVPIIIVAVDGGPRDQRKRARLLRGRRRAR